MNLVFSIVMSLSTVMTQTTTDKAMFCRDYIKGTLFNADTSECVAVSVIKDDDGNDQAIFETYVITNEEGQ